MASVADAYEIVHDTAAPEPVRFAATELGRYCTRLFNRPFPVRPGAADSVHAVVLIAADVERPAAQAVDPGVKLGEEGFAITSKEGWLRISGGGPRGTLYGVYSLLESTFGCRWFTPHPEDEIVPALAIERLRQVMSRGLAMRESPDFVHRQREFREVKPMTEHTTARIIEQIDWWAKLRMNCFLINFGYVRNAKLWRRWKEELIPELTKRGMLLGLGEHGSYAMFLPPDRYARDHPDWYCQVGRTRLTGFKVPGEGRLAQFCTTNPDAVRTFVANFVAFAEANPEVQVYSPTPNDGGFWCECKECQRFSVGDRYLMLDNQLAQALVKLNPEIRIIHMAYANHREPPEQVQPHPNVDPDAATWGRNFAYPLTDSRTLRSKRPVFKEWLQVCRAVRKAHGMPQDGHPGPRLLYHCKFMRHLWLGPHLMPLPCLDEDMPYLRDLGLSGFDLPLAFVGIWTKALNTYVVAHQCWDADQKSGPLINDYFRAGYGQHADAARRICELVEEAFPTLVYGNPAESHALVWYHLMEPEYVLDRKLSARVLQSTETALAALGKAVVQAQRARDAATDASVRQRLRKLTHTVAWIRREQACLHQAARLACLVADYRKTPGTEEDRRAMSAAAAPCLAALERCVGELAESYKLELDVAGVYWAGSSVKVMQRSVAAWCAAIDSECVPMTPEIAIGTWQTTDFADKSDAIVKEFDVTAHIRTKGRLTVRWAYTRGQLGVSIAETALWKMRGDERDCVCRDTHNGFTGAKDSRPVYELTVGDIEPGTRYIVKGRFRPAISYGSVAARGTEGTIFLRTQR